jgi:hypothetical protein
MYQGTRGQSIPNVRKPQKAMEMWTWASVFPPWMIAQNKIRKKVPIKTRSNFLYETMARSMARYFMDPKLALRKPAVPKGEQPSGFLYRGVSLTAPLSSKFLSILKETSPIKRVWNDKGFMAWATARSVAETVARANCHYGGWFDPNCLQVVFKLDKLTGIPDGTPWVWFAKKKTSSYNNNINSNNRRCLTSARGCYYSKEEKELTFGRYNYLVSKQGPNKEIVLPPGRLLLLGNVNPDPENGKLIVPVKYQADTRHLKARARKRLPNYKTLSPPQASPPGYWKTKRVVNGWLGQKDNTITFR